MPPWYRAGMFLMDGLLQLYQQTISGFSSFTCDLRLRSTSFFCYCLLNLSRNPVPIPQKDEYSSIPPRRTMTRTTTLPKVATTQHLSTPFYAILSFSVFPPFSSFSSQISLTFTSPTRRRDAFPFSSLPPPRKANALLLLCLLHFLLLSFPIVNFFFF